MQRRIAFVLFLILSSNSIILSAIAKNRPKNNAKTYREYYEKMPAFQERNLALLKKYFTNIINIEDPQLERFYEKILDLDAITGNSQELFTTVGLLNSVKLGSIDFAATTAYFKLVINYPELLELLPPAKFMSLINELQTKQGDLAAVGLITEKLQRTIIEIDGSISAIEIFLSVMSEYPLAPWVLNQNLKVDQLSSQELTVNDATNVEFSTTLQTLRERFLQERKFLTEKKLERLELMIHARYFLGTINEILAKVPKAKETGEQTLTLHGFTLICRENPPVLNKTEVNPLTGSTERRVLILKKPGEKDKILGIATLKELAEAGRIDLSRFDQIQEFLNLDFN